MSTVRTYNLTVSEMEDFMDSAKASVLKAMVKEDVFDMEEAEEWSKTHTIILRQKTIFRSITNVWKEEEEVAGDYILVVKLPDNGVYEEDDDGEKEDIPGDLEEGDAKVVELKRRA